MRTLDYGRKVPETSDPGELWFPAIEANIARDDAHDHDGSDSKRLSGPGSSDVETQAIAAAGWAALGDGSGQYSQTIALPTVNGTQLQYDAISIEFRLSTGERVYPLVEKVSATSFKVYTNDNTKAYVALYSA